MLIVLSDGAVNHRPARSKPDANVQATCRSSVTDSTGNIGG